MEHSLMEVCRTAQAALAANSVAALRRVRVEVAGDAVLLCGLVASFYHKQLAQEVIRRIVGDFRLVNAVAVL